MSTGTDEIKQQAHQVIDGLPATASWDEIAYAIELRASVERGRADAAAGRVHTLEEVRQRFDIVE